MKEIKNLQNQLNDMNFLVHNKYYYEYFGTFSVKDCEITGCSSLPVDRPCGFNP